MPVKVAVNVEHGDRYGRYGPRSKIMAASGDLTVVAFTEFGERFCKAVIKAGHCHRV
jgi:hypothetical protein